MIARFLRTAFVPALSFTVLAACTSADGDPAADEAAFTEHKPNDEEANGRACPKLHDESGKPHFGYDDDEHGGPETWGELKGSNGKPAYPACNAGQGQQSPIALPAPRSSSSGLVRGSFELDPSNLAWSPKLKVASLINNGHTWLANVDKADRSALKDVLSEEPTVFKLAQFHFHAPSEHSIDGKPFPLEAHFVHVGPEKVQPFGEVIAVMFEQDAKDNAQLAKIWDRFDRCKQTEPTKLEGGIALDIDELLPKDRTYLEYDGSLTTPPCSRTVRFRILTNPIKASRAQIDRFRQVFADNSRPLQPIASDTAISVHEPDER